MEVLGDAILDPADKPCSFVCEANAQKSVNRKSRIAYPGVSVIPVAAAANHFRQAGGGSRDDGSARFKGEKLQGQGRSMHLLPPAPVVRAGREPIVPVVDCFLQQ